MNRCPKHVHWWDLDTTAACTRDAGHDGDHTDGDRWWDAHGLRTPRDPASQRRWPRHYGRLTAAEITDIRNRHRDGASFAAIARDLGVDYITVRKCALRLTYQDVA